MFRKSTVVQGFIWSIADFCLVYGFLTLASLIRNRLGMKRTVFRYVVFWTAAVLNPYFLFFRTGRQHDMLILCIFFLLVYAVIVDGVRMLRFILQVVES